MTKQTRLITWLTGILTLALTVIAFILSFNALRDLAHDHGVSIPPLFPFVVEFGVVVFSLNALYRSLIGASAKWQWCLIIGSSMLAGIFNVAHAQPDFLSRSMAAMPSLFLLLSFESFLSLVRFQVTRGKGSHLAQMKPKATKKPAAIEPSVSPNGSLKKANQTRQNKAELRRQKLADMPDGMSQEKMAELLNVSVSTVQRDLKMMNGQG